VKSLFRGKWLAGGLGLILCSLGLVSFVSYRNTTQLNESSIRVQETYEVINNLTDLYAAMSVAESARRGYIYWGSDEELKRYQQALADMQNELKEIQKFVKHSITLQNKFNRLKFLIEQRSSWLRESIALYQRNKKDVEEQAFITGKSILLREEILKVLTQIQNEEQVQLQHWLTRSHSNIYIRILLEAVGIGLSFLLLATIYFLIYYQWEVQHKKMENLQEKIAQEKELGEMKMKIFSMISHEFRTPLSVILGSSQLLKENLQDVVDERKLKNLYRIQSSVKLMNDLLTDILILTRAETGRLECKPEWIDIEAFCLNLVEDAQVQNPKHYAIKFISQSYCGRIYLDEKLLYSVLNNLLANAIKYSQEPGKIYLYLKCDRDSVVFKIKDNGIGITTEDIKKIYEPFYRGQNVNNIVGSGLGLAVVNKCLELQGGQIEVESEIDIGTTFTVKIPLSSNYK
jgi:signal transduction histidine kinase